MCFTELGPGRGSGDPTWRHLAGPLGTSPNVLTHARAHGICCSGSCSRLPADVSDARHLYMRYSDRAHAFPGLALGHDSTSKFLCELS